MAPTETPTPLQWAIADSGEPSLSPDYVLF